MGAVLISRSQPKILRKIQKKLLGYIPAIPRFLHVCLKISDSRNVLQTKNKNIFHDIHLERELEWGCIKEVDNGQTKYDCFHLSQIKDPVPNCNFSLEDCKSTIAPCQYLHPVSLNRTLRFSAVAVIYGFDILGNPETKYCDVRNTALPNQKYCPP